MSFPRYLRHPFAMLLALLAACSLPAQAQSLVWHNDWTVQAPPVLHFYGLGYLSFEQQTPVVFSDDGEMLLRTQPLSITDDQIVRLDATGAVRWRTNIGSVWSSDDSANNAMLANGDGSAYVAANGGSALVRIGAGGSIDWSVGTTVRALASLGNQGVAVLGCNSVTALDAQSGQLLWSHEFPSQKGQCAASWVVGDPAGNAYATFYTLADNSYLIGGFRLYKFASDGSIAWAQSAAATSEMRPFGVGAAHVYVTSIDANSSDRLQVFATADGSLSWTAAAHGLCLVGTPAQPIVAVQFGVERLREADGGALWLHPMTVGRVAHAKAGKIIIGGTALNEDTGQELWTSTLPNVDQQGNAVWYAVSGTLADGSVAFAGRNPDQVISALTLQRVDGSTGQLLGQISLAPMPQAPAINSIPAGPQTIASLVTMPAPGGTQLTLRALNAATGTVRWEANQLIDSVASLAIYNDINGIAASGDAVVGSFVEPGAVWVGAFNLADGTQRWSTTVSGPAAWQWNTVAASPVVDASGDIYVAYGAVIPPCPQGFGQNCTVSGVAKLGSADGSVLWRRDDVRGGTSPQVGASGIFVAGSDILEASAFDVPYFTKTLLRLSGSDGSVVWASDIFGPTNSVGRVFPAADGNLIVTSTGWAKVDAATGATIWNNPPNTYCGYPCFGAGLQGLSDGSVFFRGEFNRKLLLALQPPIAGAAPVNWYPDQNDANLTHSSAAFADRDSTGNVWLRIARKYGTQEIIYMSRFDPAAGTFLSQQAMFAYDGADPQLHFISPFMVAAPENQRFPAVTFVNAPPAPNAIATSLVDITIVANGNLSLQVATDHTQVLPGDLLGFHLTATYSGDAPVTGAKLIADMPWAGFATGLSCSAQSASNCQLETQASTIVASFDIQPGGRIDITGSVRATTSPGLLRALVAGPPGLNELDTTDNAAAFEPQLFANGFE